MMERVMHIWHHGNHEPALAGRIEQTEDGHTENKTAPNTARSWFRFGPPGGGKTRK